MSRDAFVSAALSLVGLTEPSEELGRLVDPGGTSAHQGAVEKESLCMLTYRGLLLRVLNIPAALAETDRPYVNSSIPRILASILASASGRRLSTLAEPPQPGDGIWWAAAPGHPEHVDACVTDVSCVPDSDDLTVTVVAGGQRDGEGHETIAELTRTLHWDGRRWVDRGTGRALMWVLDADALEARYGMRAVEPQDA